MPALILFHSLKAILPNRWANVCRS